MRAMKCEASFPGENELYNLLYMKNPINIEKTMYKILYNSKKGESKTSQNVKARQLEKAAGKSSGFFLFTFLEPFKGF